ncbi:SecDF P1 head subdomain-containing protein [Aquihabitans daechungensis]|uniref:SecDF P1 head subdomain-containing protein n=1 Tax=Aquihabitans daechungensis TaxID=1052257 RepID=UPI003B9E62A6
MRRAPALLLLVLAVGPLGLLASACGSSGSEDTSPTAASSSTTSTTKPTYADLDATAIAFHPVREIVTCDGGGIPGATTETTATSSPSSTVPSADGELCYVLGPEGGNGTDVRDAKVYADGVGIEVAVREDSVAPMNLLFNACYFAIAACPASSTEGKGYVAIVVDGRVVSTPAIEAEDLASTPFVITGNFDQAQATNVAAAINAP